MTQSDELDDEDVSALKEMAAWWRESKMTRRAALGLATGAGAAAAGGGGFMAGRASADASTSDSDGDLGNPDDRVDVFADGVDAVSLGVEDINNRNEWQFVQSETLSGGTATIDLDGSIAPVGGGEALKLVFQGLKESESNPAFLTFNGGDWDVGERVNPDGTTTDLAGNQLDIGIHGFQTTTLDMDIFTSGNAAERVIIPDAFSGHRGVTAWSGFLAVVGRTSDLNGISDVRLHADTDTVGTATLAGTVRIYHKVVN